MKLFRHPLQSFRYCPRCGTDGLQPREQTGVHCPNCGLAYFHNTAAGVACFVLDSAGNVLSVRRARDPAKGTLSLPGGFVDPLESAEAAVVREVYEETGLRIASPHYLFSLPNVYPYAGIEVFTNDLFFLARVDDFAAAKAGDDAADVVVCPRDALVAADYGLPSVRRAVERALADGILRDKTV